MCSNRWRLAPALPVAPPKMDPPATDKGADLPAAAAQVDDEKVTLAQALKPFKPESLAQRLRATPSTEMIDAMQHDKKMVAGRLHFVLPTAIGATTIVDDVTENEIRAALKKVGFAK